MAKRLTFLLALILALSLNVRAQNCPTIAYHQGYGATFYAAFPLVSGANNFTRVAYYINPVAGGTVEALRMQFYNANAAPVILHNGTLRVWAFSDVDGEPDAIVAGPVNFVTNAFVAAFGTWDEVDLSALGYTFTANVPFHIVWEFIPATAGHQLAPLGVTGAGSAMGNQMYNAGTSEWGWWFTGRGDLLEQVDICYTETPPGNLVFSGYSVDMGRIEVGGTLTETYTATNSGGMNTTITGITLTNPAFYSASIGSLPKTLTPGESADFTVTYTPGMTAVFRDTTTVSFAWTSNALPTAYTTFFAIAGSSDGLLTNDWSGSPEELDWYVSASGDTSIYGATWELFSGGLNRNFPLAGHRYTALGDTASSELYTFLDNQNLDDINWRFAYTQNYPGDTQDHALLVYGVEDGLLTYLYGYDITSFTQQAPIWAHLTASLDSLPDSLACSFYYGGSYADDWFLDDVEFNRSCSPIQIDITYQNPNVTITWATFPGETVKILRSALAYDFSAATLVGTYASGLGTVTLPATGNYWYYRAVRDCVPVPAVATAGLQRLDRHPDGIRTRRIEELRPVSRPESPDRNGQSLLQDAGKLRVDQVERLAR